MEPNQKQAKLAIMSYISDILNKMRVSDEALITVATYPLEYELELYLQRVFKEQEILDNGEEII
jgi:hypothetical protein